MKSKASELNSTSRDNHRATLRNSNFIDTQSQHYRNQLWRQNNTAAGITTVMYKHMMDCHLIQPYHCTLICFTNQSDIFPEKLLARQSCAEDSWRQHIKGLCGSAVSINRLSRSFLPSGSSTQGYIITIELPATECRGQTFKGNGIGSKQRYHCYSQHQSFSVMTYLQGSAFSKGKNSPAYMSF